MKKKEAKRKKVSNALFWTPRILSILFVLFLMMFSLDVFEEGKTATEIAIGLFMHNIPAFILAAIVWISWKKEIVGAIAFTLAGLLYFLRTTITAITTGIDTSQSLAANIGMAMSWSLTIALPAILIGILYWINWKKRRA